jgi:hypothetical protein
MNPKSLVVTLFLSSFALVELGGGFVASGKAEAAPKSAGKAGKAGKEKWEKIFDGKSMKGWKLMAVHGGQGGVWTIEKGALVADRQPDFKGGLIGTERKFTDVEVEMEFQQDFPTDSGVFLRTDDTGHGYQVTLDNRDGGHVGGIYFPGVNKPGDSWEKVFKKSEWNKLRVRVQGSPAHLEIWLNDVKTIDLTDEKNAFPKEGYLGFQVHGGQKAWGEGNRARFRNIRVKELAPAK